MKIGFLITARLKSTRLPNKLMIDIAGRRVIEHVIDRAKMIDGVDEVILCTSDDPQDDPLIDISNEEGIKHYRGSADDVLVRLLNASKLFGLDHFIGITGENALFSLMHAEKMCSVIRSSEPDHVFLKGLPIGCATYGAKVKALEVVCAIKEIVDTEIWGYLINRPEIFDIHCIETDFPNSDPTLRITLDHPEDEVFLRSIFNVLPKEKWYDFGALLGFLAKHPELKKIHGHLVQADLPEQVKNRINEHFEAKHAEIIRLKEEIYNSK